MYISEGQAAAIAGYMSASREMWVIDPLSSYALEISAAAVGVIDTLGAALVTELVYGVGVDDLAELPHLADFQICACGKGHRKSEVVFMDSTNTFVMDSAHNWSLNCVDCYMDFDRHQAELVGADLHEYASQLNAYHGQH